MSLLTNATTLISQINSFIQSIVIQGGNLAYVIMFLILYAGAAFVITAPVLPSVSLVFLVASLSVAGLLNPIISFFVLAAAIILGDITSYFLGKGVRYKLLDNCKLPFIKSEHIRRTENVYKKADFISIVFARFTPLIGSIAQMVAGAVNSKFSTFCARNITAGIIWLIVYFVGGWFIAVIPALESNFVIIFMIVPIASAIISLGYYMIKNINSSVMPKKL